MTASTINADVVYKGYTLTQDHVTSFWSISDPAQSDTGSNELYGYYMTRAQLKLIIDQVG